jgi:hypothetical protein
LVAGDLGESWAHAWHVVTVMDDGVVLALARTDGAIVGEIDVQAELGFVPLRSLGLDLELVPQLPQSVRDDFAAPFGPCGVGGVLGKFMGGSGRFSDNAVGIASEGTLYVTQRALLHSLHDETGVVSGLIRFAPTDGQ